MDRVKMFIVKMVISFLQNVLGRLSTSLNSFDDNHNEMLHLAPVITTLPKDYKHYFKQLDYFITDCSENVKEIAITGPYGSGKSTLLGTYFKSRPHLKTKFISLGTYLPPTNSEESKSSEGNKEVKELEQAIARQLLYQHSGLESLGSKFSFPVYRKRDELLSYIQAIVLIFWGVLAGYCLLSGKGDLLQWIKDGLLSNNVPIWKIGIFSYLLAVPVCVLTDVFRYLSKNRLTSVNPKGGSFDFKPIAQESISFSLHLEELLRFFIATKSDIVVIEDLDRFNIPQVFESLKELNKIVNQSARIDNPVRFIYAVRDDIFQGCDRTKFFDAIIPLIPVMSPFNAYERFKGLFPDSILAEQLEGVIRKVSVAVPDMRVLRNIVNEFYAYKTILNAQNGGNNYERLLSFIVYKNLYSNDFAKLYTNDISAIDHAVQVKERIRQQRDKELSDRYDTLLQEDQDAANELLNNEQDYFLIVLGRLSKELNVDKILTIYGSSVEEIGIDDLVSLLSKKLNHNQAPIRFIRGSKTNSQFASSKDFKDPHLSADELRKRLHSIRTKDKDRTKQRIREMYELKSKLSVTRSITWSLSEAMECNPQEDWVPEGMPVLKMLLRDGLIDEHYGLYLNHVLEGKLTGRDFEFLQALRDRQEFDPMYESSNYSEIMSFLSNGDASSPAAFNYGLLQFLLKSDSHGTFLEKLKQFQFIDHPSCATRLYKLRQTIPNWEEVLWDSVISDITSSISELSSLEGCELLSDLTCYAEDDDEISYLQNHLGSEACLLEALSRQNHHQRIISSFKEAGILISSLDEAPHLRELVKSAVEAGIVEFTSDTLTSALSVYLERKIELPVSFELITQFKSIESFANKNFSKFVELVKQGYIENVPNSFILEILGSDLGQNLIIDALTPVKFQLKTLEAVPTEYWAALISANKILISWTVIEELLKIKEKPETQIVLSVLEDKNCQQLLLAEDANCSQECKTLLKSILLEHIASTKVFANYIHHLNIHFSNDELLELSQEHVISMIDVRHIKPSLELFNNFKLNGHTDAAYQLVKQFPELIDENDFKIDSDDFSNILPLLDEQFRDKVLLGWKSYLGSSTPKEYWFHLLSQSILIDKPLSGLIKKDNGHNIQKHLDEIGVRRTYELEESQILSLLKNVPLELNEKLSLLIGQASHHKSRIKVLIEETIGTEWSLSKKACEYTPEVYALLLICLQHNLISSMRVQGDEIKVYHFKKND